MGRWLCAFLVVLLAGSLVDGSMFVTKNMPRARKDPTEIGDAGREFAAKNPHLTAQNRATPLPPILLVPGVAGSQLSSRNSNPAHWYCHQSDQYSLLWLALQSLLPGPLLQCFTTNMELQYNDQTYTFSNMTGVDVIVNYPNSTLGIEFLDPQIQFVTVYYGDLVASLLAMGYKRGVNLAGAPYDWRLGPRSSPQTFANMKAQVEDLYASNGNQKVWLIGHSMGTRLLHHLLAYPGIVDQAWKDQYVAGFIAVAPPWTGAVEAVQSIINGYNFGIPYLMPSEARPIQRTLESNYYLFPTPVQWADVPIVVTNKRNYTGMQYADLFNDMGLPNKTIVWEHVFNQTSTPLQPPNVNTFVMYGTGVKTHKQLIFPTGDFSKDAKVVIGDGDGTVNVESLVAAQVWKDQMPFKFAMQNYPGQEHVDILQDKQFISDLMSIIL
eukprot:TRINITY_DN5126_c0_g1_i3.p1 TRINITY_DN5126_c0_g1~~TRINITY_DN5126_c0_g1_i3.p1  ORF type:complete len:438 (+),score=107.58 TRINITY_DN5126_c0_g1_i3:90-1403(+)